MIQINAKPAQSTLYSDKIYAQKKAKLETRVMGVLSILFQAFDTLSFYWIWNWKRKKKWNKISQNEKQTRSTYFAVTIFRNDKSYKIVYFIETRIDIQFEIDCTGQLTNTLWSVNKINLSIEK